MDSNSPDDNNQLPPDPSGQGTKRQRRPRARRACDLCYLDHQPCRRPDGGPCERCHAQNVPCTFNCEAGSTRPNARKRLDLDDPDRNKVTRACDLCRVNHQPCDGKDPCANCVKKKVRCSYDRPIKKRGPQRGQAVRTAWQEVVIGWSLENIPGFESAISSIINAPNAAATPLGNQDIAGHYQQTCTNSQTMMAFGARYSENVGYSRNEERRTREAKQRQQLMSQLSSRQRGQNTFMERSSTYETPSTQGASPTDHESEVLERALTNELQSSTTSTGYTPIQSPQAMNLDHQPTNSVVNLEESPMHYQTSHARNPVFPRAEHPAFNSVSTNGRDSAAENRGIPDMDSWLDFMNTPINSSLSNATNANAASHNMRVSLNMYDRYNPPAAVFGHTSPFASYPSVSTNVQHSYNYPRVPPRNVQHEHLPLAAYDPSTRRTPVNSRQANPVIDPELEASTQSVTTTEETPSATTYNETYQPNVSLDGAFDFAPSGNHPSMSIDKLFEELASVEDRQVSEQPRQFARNLGFTSGFAGLEDIMMGDPDLP